MTDFDRLLHVLADQDVEFIVIGGVAATAYGATRLTEDVDILYRRSTENMNRLATALDPLNPYPRDVPPGLPFRWDSQTIERGLNFTLTTDAGALDLLGEIVGGGTYDDLVHESSELEVFGAHVRCLSLPQLIRAKRAAGRPKDLQAVAELERIWEARPSGET